MNQKGLSKTDLASWRDMMTAPEPIGLIAMAALSLLSMLILPFSGNEGACLLYAITVTGTLYFLSHSLGYVLGVLLPAAVLWLLSGTLALPALFTVFLLGGGGFAIVLLSCKKKLHLALTALLPLTAYGITLLAKGDPLNALLVCMPAIVGLAGYFALRYCLPHTEAVVLLAAALGATLIIAGLLTMLAMGLLTTNPLAGLGDALRNTLTARLLSVLEEARTLYAEAGLEIAISDTAVKNVVILLVNMLPGLFLVCCTVVAFFVWRFLLNLLINLRMLPRLPLRMTLLLIAPSTAVVFLLSYFTSLAANSVTPTPVGTVALNLALALGPGLALIGISSLVPRGRSKSCLSVLLLVGLVLLLFSNPLSAFSLAAILGAIQVLLARFLHKGEKNPPQDP